VARRRRRRRAADAATRREESAISVWADGDWEWEWKITNRSSSLLSLANFCYVDGLAGWKLVGDFIGGS
jgi:hypothetical protein